MNDGPGLSRGDRNRNARLGRLRVLLPPHNAIVGIDLAYSTPGATRARRFLPASEPEGLA